MFRIGEFSKIARVTTRQLRYYAECGLLQPAQIDKETGYRYYSASQLPRLHQILALKDLGLSLDQIARFLMDEVSPDELRGMLAMKKAQLELQVQEELLRIQQIENRISQIQTDGALRNIGVIIQEMPEQKFLSVHTTVASLENAIQMTYEISRILPMRAGRDALGPLTIVMHSDEYVMEQLDIEIGFQVKHEIVDEIQLSNGLQLTMSSLPAVSQMATVAREGVFGDHISCYSTAGRWIEDKGYQIAGAMREVFMSPLIPGKESEIVVETQIPVELIDAPTLPF